MKCWVVTEGMAGTENQCIGVAEALGVTPDIKRIGLRQPWKAFSPFLAFERSFSFTGSPLEPPWPDLVLASGRKAVAAARYIKKASGGSVFTAFLQDPRIEPDAFDLVAVPAHDGVRGGNVVVTLAAPNRINAEKLSNARNEWQPVFESLRNPRVAVLVGGKSKAYTMTEKTAEKLAASLQEISARYGLMVTMSRRTGENNQTVLHSALSGSDAWVWNGTGDNPYFGMLAWADFIIVTADSVSMISEAATTGKPVYIAMLDGGNERFARFHQSLTDRGVARIFDGNLETYAYSALNDAALVAGEISARFAQKHKIV